MPKMISLLCMEHSAQNARKLAEVLDPQLDAYLSKVAHQHGIREWSLEVVPRGNSIGLVGEVNDLAWWWDVDVKMKKWFICDGERFHADGPHVIPLKDAGKLTEYFLEAEEDTRRTWQWPIRHRLYFVKTDRGVELYAKPAHQRRKLLAIIPHWLVGLFELDVRTQVEGDD